MNRRPLTRGAADGGFDPEGRLSRAQKAAFLARLWRDTLAQPCPAGPAHGFTDVDAGHWAAADIACIHALGIAKGTTAETFSPSAGLDTAAVTRFAARLLNRRTAGTCDLSGDELAAAAACLHTRNIAPSTVEAAGWDNIEQVEFGSYDAAIAEAYAGTRTADRTSSTCGRPAPTWPTWCPAWTPCGCRRCRTRSSRRGPREGGLIAVSN